MTSGTIGAPPQPKLFISYAQSDKLFADQVVRALAERGVTTWRPDQLNAGDSVAASIGEAIRRSDAVVVLLSHEATKSPWVSREIAFALSGDNREGPKRVIPVLLEPTVELPPFLRDLRYVDLSHRSRFEQGVDELVSAAAAEPRLRKEQEREIQLRRRMLAAEQAALLQAVRQMEEEYLIQSAKLTRTLAFVSVAVAIVAGVVLITGMFVKLSALAGIVAGLGGLAVGVALAYRRALKR